MTQKENREGEGWFENTAIELIDKEAAKLFDECKRRLEDESIVESINDARATLVQVLSVDTRRREGRMSLYETGGFTCLSKPSDVLQLVEDVMASVSHREKIPIGVGITGPIVRAGDIRWVPAAMSVAFVNMRVRIAWIDIDDTLETVERWYTIHKAGGLEYLIDRQGEFAMIAEVVRVAIERMKTTLDRLSRGE